MQHAPMEQMILWGMDSPAQEFDLQNDFVNSRPHPIKSYTVLLAYVSAILVHTFTPFTAKLLSYVKCVTTCLDV